MFKFFTIFSLLTLFGCAENTENTPLVSEPETETEQYIGDPRISEWGHTTKLKHYFGKHFVLEGGVWTDLDFVPGMKTTKIIYKSNAHLANKRVDQYFKMGADHVIVCFDEQGYPCYELVR